MKWLVDALAAVGLAGQGTGVRPILLHWVGATVPLSCREPCLTSQSDLNVPKPVSIKDSWYVLVFHPALYVAERNFKNPPDSLGGGADRSSGHAATLSLLPGVVANAETCGIPVLTSDSHWGCEAKTWACWEFPKQKRRNLTDTYVARNLQRTLFIVPLFLQFLCLLPTCNSQS
jgi:hypothetical protein